MNKYSREYDSYLKLHLPHRTDIGRAECNHRPTFLSPTQLADSIHDVDCKVCLKIIRAFNFNKDAYFKNQEAKGPDLLP